MRFNVKHINEGDDKITIINKINYNFDQILSFAVGPRGTRGSIGRRGIVGVAGDTGHIGATGDRCNIWFQQDTDPNNGDNIVEFDMWIDTSSEFATVNQYLYNTLTSSYEWQVTGLSLFTSTLFKAYNNIINANSISNKNAIGLSNDINVLDPAKTSFVMSDTILINDANLNNSKLVISTDEEINRPILSFTKSESANRSVPAFSWDDISNGSITYSSLGNYGGSFDVSAKGENLIDFSLGDVIFSANVMKVNANTIASINSIGSVDFTLATFLTNPSIGNIIFNSTNINMDTSTLNANTPIIINSDKINSYVLTVEPTINSQDGGMVIESSSNITTTDKKTFTFKDFSDASVLSGSILNNNIKTIFGENTQTSVDYKAGEYSYHIKKINNIIPSIISQTNALDDDRGLLANIKNVIDISDPSLWRNNILTINVLNYPIVTSTDVYIKIPSTSVTSSVQPLFLLDTNTEYRVILDNITALSAFKIAGIVYDVISSTNNTPIQYYRNFVAGCNYIDLNWIPKGNSDVPRLFYKDCIGNGGWLDFVTNEQAPSPVNLTWTQISLDRATGSVYNTPLWFNNDSNFDNFTCRMDPVLDPFVTGSYWINTTSWETATLLLQDIFVNGTWNPNTDTITSANFTQPGLYRGLGSDDSPTPAISGQPYSPNMVFGIVGSRVWYTQYNSTFPVTVINNPAVNNHTYFGRVTDSISNGVLNSKIYVCDSLNNGGSSYSGLQKSTANNGSPPQCGGPSWSSINNTAFYNFPSQNSPNDPALGLVNSSGQQVTEYYPADLDLLRDKLILGETNTGGTINVGLNGTVDDSWAQITNGWYRVVGGIYKWYYDKNTDKLSTKTLC